VWAVSGGVWASKKRRSLGPLGSRCTGLAIEWGLRVGHQWPIIWFLGPQICGVSSGGLKWESQVGWLSITYVSNFARCQIYCVMYGSFVSLLATRTITRTLRLTVAYRRARPTTILLIPVLSFLIFAPELTN
jgi:hypothetical protein